MKHRNQPTHLFRGLATPLAAIILTVLFGLSVPSLRAQSVRPTPTPATGGEVPEVISRDDDIEDLIRERTAREQRPAARTTRPRTPAADDAALGLDAMTEKEQKRVIFYLDILTKLEQRAESLRAQLIDMIEKQNNVTTKIQQVEYNLRPEVISGYTSLSGSFRPEDLREQRESELEIEKRNLENLLSQIETNITNLESNLIRADQMAEKVRLTFEAVLEEALFNSPNP